MLSNLTFVLALVSVPAQPQPQPAPAVPVVLQDQDRKAEYEKMREEAEGDAEKLWKLYDWCDAYGLSREGRSVLRAIVKLDDSKKAHELLGEIFFDGKWFANERKVEDYKRKKLEEEAEAAGKVVYKGELVDAEDLPYLERGMVKTESGEWMRAEDYERQQQGWLRQDLEWVPPDEAENMEKGLYKCGDAWLSLDEANKYHSELGQWWRIPSDHFVVYSTCTREIAESAIWEAERIYSELVRIFGRAPDKQVMTLVLRSPEQYNQFATGSQTEPIEFSGFSSLHGAFFAEIWPEPYYNGFTGAGVAYWDTSNDAGYAFGRTFVRHAAGQSFIEALDPSPKAVAGMASGSASAEEFWNEKQLPKWFRYGGAVYVERYFVDSSNPEEQGGPLAWRNWSITNIARAGGLDPLERVFDFELSLDDLPNSAKLMNEAGLLVAFVVDGGCKPVVAKHLALKDALKKGEGVEKASEALEKEILKNESELRKFAGL